MEQLWKDIPTLRHKHQEVRRESAPVRNVGGWERAPKRRQRHLRHFHCIVILKKMPLMKAERLKALRQSYERFYLYNLIYKS